MKKASKKMIVRMKNLFIAAGLSGSLFAGQIAIAAEGDYAVAENIIDITPYGGETIDVTGYTMINDRIGFEDQRNYYSFTAPVDGNYDFIFEPSAGLDVFMYEIKDEYGGMVAESSYVNKVKEEIVLLDAGMNYDITIEEYAYKSYFGKYSVEIIYPSSAQQFLDDFSQGIIEEEDTNEVEEETDEEVEESAEVEDSESSNEDLILQQLEELQSKMDTLESEINDVKDENENLKDVLEENEIEYD